MVTIVYRIVTGDNSEIKPKSGAAVGSLEHGLRNIRQVMSRTKTLKKIKTSRHVRGKNRLNKQSKKKVKKVETNNLPRFYKLRKPAEPIVVANEENQ